MIDEMMAKMTLMRTMDEAGRPETFSRNGRTAPSGRIYKYFYNGPTGGLHEMWVVENGKPIRLAEAGEVSREFGLKEGECPFCHFNESDIHSATRDMCRIRYGRSWD